MNRLALGALLLGLLVSTPARAHQKSVSYSKWTLLDDGAIAEVKVRWLELTSLPAASTDADVDRSSALPYLQTSLSLQSSTGPCEAIPSSATWLPAERGWVRVEWRVTCDSRPTTLRSELFTSLTNHVHLATVLNPEPIKRPQQY